MQGKGKEGGNGPAVRHDVVRVCIKTLSAFENVKCSKGSKRLRTNHRGQRAMIVETVLRECYDENWW